MDTKNRYQYLLILLREDVATEDEKKEFYDLCQQLLYAMILDNVDVFKRLAKR